VPIAPGQVAGRCFIKQDHQGPEPGFAHDGLIATALLEAMALAAEARPVRFEMAIEGRAPVGVFLEVRAQTEGGGAWATAKVDGERVAVARGALST
jgi:acyl-coenzyme A thioesterase PaaI-like protein